MELMALCSEADHNNLVH